ncbi:ATP-binding cassette domain-containing protein [Microvirga sp. 2MCAF38]|uniref:ATP-binding cassette domain-containing protein n=1 Tax=Microvirga sp. 2MCAF38 TaxID=3232989 RepID=UPI003F94E043
MSAPLLDIRDLSKNFRRAGEPVPALIDVNLTLSSGETLALVGPSGSGKSTLARIVMRLMEPDRGAIHFGGEDILSLDGAKLRAARAKLQMVFQDPLAAFNPRATVSGVLDDPLRIHGIVPRVERPRAIAGLLDRVGLAPRIAERAIHDISGGQRQRVAIARALATKPSLIVLDEAVSALDVSVRAQILNLLMDLQQEERIAFLFISHDLGVVRAIAHRVAIMETGRIVETGLVRDVIANPISAIGSALVAAVPKLHRPRSKDIAP